MKRQNKYSPSRRKPVALHDGPTAPPAGAESMVRTQIYLSRPEYNHVQAEAAQRGEPMAAVIRSYIEEKMQLPEDAWRDNPMLKPTPRDPEFQLPEDAAINHDYYLYGAPKKYVKQRGKWVPARAQEAGR